MPSEVKHFGIKCTWFDENDPMTYSCTLYVRITKEMYLGNNLDKVDQKWAYGLQTTAVLKDADRLTIEQIDKHTDN